VNDSLQPQDLVITILGTYVRPHRDTVWSGGLVTLLRELGFSDGAARVALTRLVRRELLVRERSGRLVHYRLTPRCDRLLAEGDGRIFKLGEPHPAGERWTVVWHQIPEDRRLERSRLARRLRFLSFGSVQDSLWVSPHDHREEVISLLGELRMESYAAVFVAQLAALDGLPALVSRAWDLTGLRERYEAFAGEFAPYRRRGAAASLTDPEAFRVRTRLVHRFRGFASADPELPEELAVLAGPRSRAVSTFHVLYRALAPASQRHFDAVTRAWALAS
jgi:phenylacetic acid degradation operon negative regulatory protein